MDLAFEAVGPQGKFQKIIAFLVILANPLAFLMSTSYPFMIKKPIFQCQSKQTQAEFNICPKKDLCKNEFFRYEKIPETSFNNWAYDFDLYCSKAYIFPVILTNFFCGGIIGNLFISHLPDRYGRKEIYKIILLSSFVLHLNIFLAINEWHILFTNILLGIVSYASSMSSFIITEYIDRETAGLVMSLNNAALPFSGILIALFFVYLNNWRLLFFISSALSLFCVIISQKYFVESPRWLNSKNKFSETLNVLREIAKINDNEQNFNRFLQVNETLIKKTNTSLKEIKKSYNIYEVFHFKSQRKTLLILAFILLSIRIGASGLLLNLEHSNNIIADSIVSFSGDIISTMISCYFADKYGRLFVLKFAGFLGCVGFILLFAFSSGNQTLKTLLIFLTSFGFAASFNVFYIYSPEVFPTTVRSTVMGFFSLISRLGLMLAPTLNAVVPYSQLFFGGLGFFSSCLCFLLTESLGKAICDDMPEVIRRKSFLSTVIVSAARRESLNCYRKMSINKALLSDSLLKIDA